jgi:bacterioferritin-associated ferredoxin
MIKGIFSLKGRGGGPEGKTPGRSACAGKRARGVLVVDCHECHHPQDLADHNCLKGVLRLMAADPTGLHELMLCKDWEIVYDKECVMVLGRLTEVIRFCNGLAFQQPFDDCSSCRSNPRSVISRVIEALPQAAPELDSERPTPSGGHGRACEQCVRSLRSNLDHARVLLTQAEDLVNKTAFRVVTDREH